ncbi:diacylglycerol kinase family enzyme [Arcanobacterium wilhelmae]|uniref:Diacylglycerol kinase family enzyme n=1 Tax=Arcanobacterium wilhelmae TaxID=1803177 RepID=A0ABT9NBA5_9ACTO|nr:diacylglycerol kinase family protein [Arcanobacterium wilhelmae]MDP9800790.1 diacylglycerol kinase family enzyme [Arcanobacterium wilhelmae]WFN90167.1 diacylglycerol kinase family protein [Arcanobacterium wilhelmae]
MTWSMLVALIALGVAVFALLTAWKNQAALAAYKKRLSRGQHTPAARAAAENDGPPVVVYNPTKKADFDYLKQTLSRVAADASLPEPVWLATTAEDTGTGQTKQAIEMGASVVIAAGGDGTVTEVGAALAGSGVPMGLLPVGTGNLLARNLNLPLDSERDMAVIALTGRDRALDLGHMIVPEQDADAAELAAALKRDHTSAELAKPGDYPFLVIAGVGFDAEIMGGTSSQLKEQIGWLAYVRAAIPAAFAKRMHLTLRVGSGAADETAVVETDARSVMFLNCGEITGGLVLDPDAKPDDGWLELAVLDTRGGIFGWAALASKLGTGMRAPKNKSLSGQIGSMDMHRIREVSVETRTFQQIQADGDAYGYARSVCARIDPAVLRVRVGN